MKGSFKVEVDLPGKIEDYEKLLSKYSNWKKYKREINLSQILEGSKKIEFEIQFLNNHSVLYTSLYGDEEQIMPKNACAFITKIKFIILNNIVLNIAAYCNKLETDSGEILENIIKSNINLKLYQNKDIQGQVISFYFINKLI